MNPYCELTEGCFNPKEGNTRGCGTCNRELRNIEKKLNTPVKLNAKIKKQGIGQAKIAAMLRATYAEMDKEKGTRKFICEATGEFSGYIDHDHTISQKRCKHLNKPWLIWDKRNIVYSSRKAHMEWESYKDGKFAKHKNFNERMAFLKEHDIEGREKRMMALESIKKVRPVIVPTDHITRY